MLKQSNKYLNYKYNSIIKNNQAKKIITVNRINHGTYNSPKLNTIDRRLSSENYINTFSTFNDRKRKSFVYKKSYIEKPKSVQQSKDNKKIDINKMMTLENNSINDSISLYFASPQRNLETINNTSSFNYTNSKKRLKVRRKCEPICQIYYKHNNDDISVFDKTPRNEISKLNKKKNNSCCCFNLNNIKKNNNNTLYNKNKTTLVNSSSSTTFSFNESIKNKIKKMKNSTLNNYYTSHFSIDYSFERKQYVYKKAIISPSECYSYDDIILKEKNKSASINNNLNKNTIEENIPLVTFGNNMTENRKMTRNIFRKSNKYNKNNNNIIYIDKLKKENEYLKNELIKTNEKIFLLENKIENLIEQKITNNQFKSKLFTYKKNNINKSPKCPQPTPYVQKFSKKDFFPKEKNIKVNLKLKEKIKPVIDRIFRSYNKKGKNEKICKSTHLNIKRFNNKSKNFIFSSPRSILKTKIEIKHNKNKRTFHEFHNQIENIIT